MINDVDPGYDVCSKPKDQAMMAGKTIGDLLNNSRHHLGLVHGRLRSLDQQCQWLDRLQAQHLFRDRACDRGRLHRASCLVPYMPRPPIQGTSGQARSPQSATTIKHDGKTRDPANHNYDLNDFYAAVKAGNFPSVSYIKLPAYQDGHAKYSDPLDEQEGTVELINFLQQRPDWKSTAVIVTWDDFDGWYDHAFAKVTNPSFDSEADQLDGPGKCGTGAPLAGVNGKPVNGRCGREPVCRSW